MSMLGASVVGFSLWFLVRYGFSSLYTVDQNERAANQVNIITSFAEKTAAVEFAKAAAVRPKIVGDALCEIARDADVTACLFEVLEVQNLLESKAAITLVPRNSPVLSSLIAAQGGVSPAT